MPPQGKHVPSFSASVSSFYTNHVDTTAQDIMKQTIFTDKHQQRGKPEVAGGSGGKLVATMSCIVTSSRISSAHNTKQNKCPLLIKPHNKCRPFVFPFILSTQGETRSKDFRTARRIKRGCCSFCSCFSHFCSCYFSCFGCCGFLLLPPPPWPGWRGRGFIVATDVT